MATAKQKKAAAAAALKKIEQAEAKRTSFIKALAPGTTWVTITKKLIDKVDRVVAEVFVKPTEKPDVKIVQKLPPGKGFQPNGYYFDLRLSFALGPQTPANDPSPAFTVNELTDWGRHFGNPLVNPHLDTIYMVKLTLAQLRVEPLVSGFIIHWIRPRNWAWADGQATDIPIQVASNPMIVTRLIRTPLLAASMGNDGFTVRVKAIYP